MQDLLHEFVAALEVPWGLRSGSRERIMCARRACPDEVRARLEHPGLEVEDVAADVRLEFGVEVDARHAPTLGSEDTPDASRATKKFEEVGHVCLFCEPDHNSC